MARRVLVDFHHISCSDLRPNSLLVLHPHYYVKISVGDSLHGRHQEQKTKVNCSGGAKPEWEEEFHFLVNEEERKLYFEFGVISVMMFPLKDIVVGTARVPIKDLIGRPKGCDRYQMKSADGRSNGVLSFFFKASFVHEEEEGFNKPVPVPEEICFPSPPPPTPPHLPVAEGYYFPPPTPPPLPPYAAEGYYYPPPLLPPNPPPLTLPAEEEYHDQAPQDTWPAPCYPLPAPDVCNLSPEQMLYGFYKFQ